MNPTLELLFTFRGRIGRGTFWWTWLAASAAFVVLFVFLRAEAGARSTLLLYPPYLWISLALLVKRLRDRGRAPAWLLLALIPVIGPLLLFVEAGLRKGTPGENHYGPDPRDIDSDYLTVDIGRP